MIDKEMKWCEECSAVGLMWLAKAGGNRSKCSCIVCGHIDNYDQSNIRRGKVKCSNCYYTKLREECSAVGLMWVKKVDGNRSKCSCNVCGHVDDYDQGAIRRGKVKCSNCYYTKLRE